MLVEGSNKVYTWKDGWTVATVDHGRCAQFEHTIIIHKDGAEILTCTVCNKQSRGQREHGDGDCGDGGDGDDDCGVAGEAFSPRQTLPAPARFHFPSLGLAPFRRRKHRKMCSWQSWGREACSIGRRPALRRFPSCPSAGSARTSAPFRPSNTPSHPCICPPASRNDFAFCSYQIRLLCCK